MTQEYRVNQQITARDVRLVGDNGQTIMSLRDAIRLATEAEMDLVQFSEGDIPTVKILEFSKFKFEQAKKKKEADKKARASRSELKELQLRPVTDDNDINRLIKHANEFLTQGHKVRLVCKFRGREGMYRSAAFDKMNFIVDSLGGSLDGKISNQDRSIIAFVKP